MKLILDTVFINEVKEILSLDICDGFNLNPISLIKESKDISSYLKEFNLATDLPLFIDLFSDNTSETLEQIKKIKKLSPNICIKLPFNILNLKLCKELSEEGFLIEISYCTSTSHAILAYKAGAAFISPTLSLVDDFSFSGLNLIKEIKDLYENYPECQTEIKASGLKSASDVIDCFQAGVDYCVVSYRIINYMLSNPIGETMVKKYNTEFKKILY